MATILKGYRGQSNPEDPIRDITKTYVGTPGGGGGTDPEGKEAEEMAKYKALVEKAETKGWSDRKRIRKGVDANPKDFLPSNTKAVFNLKGEWTDTRKKWGGGSGNEEGGKLKLKFPSLKRNKPTPTTEVEEEEVKYKPIKVKTNKNPYKSKYLKGKGKHRKKVRFLQNFSGVRRG